jgi:hypothetical protein
VGDVGGEGGEGGVCEGRQIYALAVQVERLGCQVAPRSTRPMHSVNRSSNESCRVCCAEQQQQDCGGSSLHYRHRGLYAVWAIWTI